MKMILNVRITRTLHLTGHLPREILTFRVTDFTISSWRAAPNVPARRAEAASNVEPVNLLRFASS
jgi:hypothetical protein